MLSYDRQDNLSALTPRPLTELLACPGQLEQQLGAAAQRRHYAAGELLFAQGTECDGLYLLLTGEFARSAQRREKRLTLGTLHAGDLVELAAVLGDHRHNYTLAASTDAAALVFPMSVLQAAFQEYPPLRMHLLEELGREVSRAYGLVYLPRKTRIRHPGGGR
ncbi:MAG TPA: Crp/Fnr family transcriptional regulator [Acidisarcina sp.]|nr:Crp/Fnr family transcriptional regulator [Acidisarcina sp.]